MAKANRIVDGKRNANIPVDMSDHFYDHGNEYCRYLITDPRSDRQGKKRKPFEKLVYITIDKELFHSGCL